MDSNFSILNTIPLKNGRQLVLRKPVEADAAAMIRYLNRVGGESDNLLFGQDEFPLTAEQEAEYIRNANSDANRLLLVGTIDGEIASVAQISCPNRKRIAHNSELAISVRKDFWQIGVGGAVMAELIRFARSNGTIRTISLGVRAGNGPARKMYEKLGFQVVGRHKDYFNINGTFDDEILMDLYL